MQFVLTLKRVWLELCILTNWAGFVTQNRNSDFGFHLSFLPFNLMKVFILLFVSLHSGILVTMHSNGYLEWESCYLEIRHVFAVNNTPLIIIIIDISFYSSTFIYRLYIDAKSKQILNLFFIITYKLLCKDL